MDPVIRADIHSSAHTDSYITKRGTLWISLSVD